MAKKPVETNPFVQALVVNAIWKIDFEHETSAIEGQIGSTRIARSMLMDVDNRTSVYTEHLLGWFKDLPSSGKDMFIYIAAHMRYAKDVIELNDEDYCKAMGITRTTFYTAKASLTNRLIIPRQSRKNTYWVNPAYLFRGDRTKVFFDRVKPGNENPLDRISEGR